MKAQAWLGLDLVFLVLMVMVIGPSAAAISLLISALPLPAWALALLSPVFASLFLVGMCLSAWVVRGLLLPRLTPGTYAFPGHQQSVVWMIHFALMRIMNFRLWSNVILSFAGLRWLSLRAQGAKVALGIQTSSDALVTDPALFEINEGCMLAAGTIVSSHFVENDQLMLAPVSLARGVQVMGGVALTPGLQVGENSVLGPGSRFLPNVVIGADVYLGMGCIIYQGVRIGDNAVIGHQVTVENDVVIGEGAVIQAGVRVPKGTVIAAGEAYPPRASSRPTSASSTVS